MDLTQESIHGGGGRKKGMLTASASNTATQICIRGFVNELASMDSMILVSIFSPGKSGTIPLSLDWDILGSL